MIRSMRKTDADRVADIWLEGNQKAHHFIDAQYWRDNLIPVKEQISQAEVYVWEERNQIQGFIGLSGTYIAGIFVAQEAQSRGIGRQLLDFAKGLRMQLSLCVYRKNVRAVEFYRREGFTVQEEGIDEDTGEAEYRMLWKRE